MNYVSIIFESLERQKRFHLKNIGMINNTYDRDDYIDMMKEDYMVELHIRNSFILREYKKRFLNNLITENDYNHKKDVINFFEFLKKSALVEMGLSTTKIYSMLISEQSLLDYGKALYNKGKQVVNKAVNKGKQVVKKVVDKGKQVVKKAAEVVSPYIKKVLDSQFAYFIPGLNVIKLGKDAKAVYDNWEKIKKMTLDDWAEAFRNFLNGATGIAIQIVLALTGVGNAANLIAWGLLLGYDVIYYPATKGKINFYNVCTSAVGLLGSGAAAVAFKPLKSLLSSVTSAKSLGPTIAKGAPKLMSKIVPLIKSIGSGAATIIQKMGQAINWLITKIPLIGKLLKPIQSGLSKVKGFIDELVEGFKKYFDKGAFQNMKVAKGTHFDLPSIGKKLIALADKKLTKKAIGGITAIVYTMVAGDTLQKVVAKYQLPGIDYLKKLNPDLASLGPGKDVVVGHI